MLWSDRIALPAIIHMTPAHLLLVKSSNRRVMLSCLVIAVRFFLNEAVNQFL